MVRDLRGKFSLDVCLDLCLLGVWKAWRAIGLAFGDMRCVHDDVVFMYDLQNPSLYDESGDLESVVSKVYFMFSGPVVGPHCLYTYRLGNVLF
jgi:hypothetical protein